MGKSLFPKRRAPINPKIKERAHKRAAGRCEQCGEPGDRSNWELRVFHLTRERMGNERLSDVLVLCLPCYRKEYPNLLVETRSQKVLRLKVERMRKYGPPKPGRKPSTPESRKAWEEKQRRKKEEACKRKRAHQRKRVHDPEFQTEKERQDMASTMRRRARKIDRRRGGGAGSSEFFPNWKRDG